MARHFSEQKMQSPLRFGLSPPRSKVAFRSCKTLTYAVSSSNGCREPPVLALSRYTALRTGAATTKPSREFFLASSSFFARRLAFDHRSHADAKAHGRCTVEARAPGNSGMRGRAVALSR